MMENYSNFDWDTIFCQMSSSKVGKRVNRYRIDCGMSVEELAQGIGKSRSTISRIEQGKQELNIDQLYKISHILNINCSKLIMDADFESKAML